MCVTNTPPHTGLEQQAGFMEYVFRATRACNGGDLVKSVEKIRQDIF